MRGCLGIESLEQSMNKNKFESIKDSMTRQPLTVQIPKFEFETEYNLISPLQNLGLHDAFDENNANFQEMTDEQVYLGQAVHKAFVNVNMRQNTISYPHYKILDCMMPLMKTMQIFRK